MIILWKVALYKFLILLLLLLLLIFQVFACVFKKTIKEIAVVRSPFNKSICDVFSQSFKQKMFVRLKVTFQ